MSFAFTPGYVFNGTNTDNATRVIHLVMMSTTRMVLTKLKFPIPSFTINFKDSTSMSTWRSSDHTITFDYTGTDGAQNWEITDADLTTSEEYSVNTTYNYIHYGLAGLVGGFTNANDMADDISSNGTGSSILDIEIDA